MIYAFFALCFLGSALAQVPGTGSCPDVEAMKDFSIAKYMGRWYEAERYFAAFEVAAKCVMADYSMNEDGTVKVVNSRISEITGNPSSVEGTARTPDASEPAKLKIKFPSMPFGLEGKYWVVGTDYDSFAVVYSCSSWNFVNVKYAWILTRDQNPSEEVINKANKVIEDKKIKRSSFLKTDQTNCNQTPI